LFVVEEQLFSGGKDEIGPAVNALQHLVLEFHKAPFNPAPLRGNQVEQLNSVPGWTYRQS
jgi:hypothetical protein